MTDNGTHLRRPEHEAHAELVQVLDAGARWRAERNGQEADRLVRESDRYHRWARADARRAAGFYEASVARADTARWLVRHEDLWGQAGTPADADDMARVLGQIADTFLRSSFHNTEQARQLRELAGSYRQRAREAQAALVEQDARDYSHDEPCPKCGRRQWGLGPGTVDPFNPSDAEQETCGACGYQWQEED